MKKPIIITLIILVVIVGITAYLNQKEVANKGLLQEKALIAIKADGQEVEQINFAFIKEQGELTFNKELDTSDSEPRDHRYTGVPLKNIITGVGIELADRQQIIVRAIDGYTVALTSTEVLADDNIYLVYKKDGQYLKGKKEGGSGPYMIVIRRDQFGQRWCKFVIEVEVK